jgi:hypothetical protein
LAEFGRIAPEMEHLHYFAWNFPSPGGFCRVALGFPGIYIGSVCLQNQWLKNPYTQQHNRQIKEAKLVQDDSPCDTGDTHRYESHSEIEIFVKILYIITKT